MTIPPRRTAASSLLFCAAHDSTRFRLECLLAFVGEHLVLGHTEAIKIAFPRFFRLKILDKFPDALIIGSDQVALLNGQQLGKPHTFENAKKQLLAASGQTVVFHTALCLLNSHSGNMQACVVPISVNFRMLSQDQIERYLKKEQPYNCAGSAKSEGLGIALIERFDGDDPNALVGLPLIALVGMLNNEGVAVP